jgi:methionyl-tRNA formyltransferase
MRVIILTTDTPHHLYFVKEVSGFFNITGIAVESRVLKASFKTHHSFEDERNSYEIAELLKKEKVFFTDFSKTKVFNNINDHECFRFVKDLKPDVIITFGTGIIKKNLISLCKDGFINLHGGDPEYYRGLDSHLWAIYNREFEYLSVTLHRLNLSLDDGEIIEKDLIKLNKNSKIINLRAETTKLCVHLILSALSSFKNFGFFVSKPQERKGKYYSFMPAENKKVCLKNFEQHIESVQNSVSG